MFEKQQLYGEIKRLKKCKKKSKQKNLFCISLWTLRSLQYKTFKGAYWISSNSSFLYCSPFSYRSSNFAIEKLLLLLALKSDSEE